MVSEISINHLNFTNRKLLERYYIYIYSEENFVLYKLYTNKLGGNNIQCKDNYS